MPSSYSFFSSKKIVNNHNGKKRKETVCKTSCRGKHLKKTNDTLENEEPENTTTENSITPELKHNNVGNYQKNSNKQETIVEEETTKKNIYREPVIVANEDKDNQEQIPNGTRVTFTITQANNKKEKENADHNPSVIESGEIEVKQTECNTVSDLSTLPSQYNNNSNWPSLHEKVMFDNEATLNMIERFVKNDIFHSLKFISSPEMMMFSKDARSLCQFTCTKFNVTKEYQSNFWSMYSKYIPKFLNKKRADVSNALKKHFQGKI